MDGFERAVPPGRPPKFVFYDTGWVIHVYRLALVHGVNHGFITSELRYVHERAGRPGSRRTQNGK